MRKIARQMVWRFILMVVLIGLLTEAQSQEASINWTEKYHLRSLVRVSHEIVDSAGFIQVFLKMDFREGLNLSEYRFFYGLTSEFDPTKVSFLNLDLDQTTVYQLKDQRVIKINIPSGTSIPNLLLKIQNPGEELESYFYIILQSPYFFDHSTLSIWTEQGKELLFENYISYEDSIILRSTRTDITSAHVYLYNHNFPPADPPVSTSPSPGKSLTIDSVYTIPLNQPLLLSRPGLYFFQTDSASFAGTSVMVTDKAYPGAGSIEELIEPLIYVSTKEETQRLRNAPEKKKALDKYLMDLTRSKDRAKLFVRHYYKRVQESNQLFTNYKEGWKTDKGMVFILMGIPDRMEPKDDRELWTYNLPNGEVVFTFVRVKSIFTKGHHRLIRDKSYDRMWFNVVDQWRKGKFRF